MHSTEQIDGDRELAARQHGVVGKSQLIALGVGKHAIEHRLDRGRLHRVHRGVYAVGQDVDHRRADGWPPYWPRAGCSSELSIRRSPLGDQTHRLAADIEVTARRGRRAQPRHRSSTTTVSRPDEVTIIDGIPVTTVARTLLDLAGVLDRRQLERAVNQAEVLRSRCHARRSTTLLASPPTPPRRRRPSHPPRCRLFGHHPQRPRGSIRGLPRPLLPAAPELNVPMQIRTAPGSSAIASGAAQRVIVELDGHAAHGTRHGVRARPQARPRTAGRRLARGPRDLAPAACGERRRARQQTCALLC